MLIAITLWALSCSNASLPYDESVAVEAGHIALASYVGFHQQLHFADGPKLLCPACSLPGSINVSTVRQYTSGGTVSAAALVGRVGQDLVLAFSGASPDGFNPLSGLFVLEELNSTQCSGVQFCLEFNKFQHRS